MKDSEIRGLILRYYYERRRQQWSLPTPADLGVDVSEDDILQVADQLGQHNLLEWRSRGSQGTVHMGMGKINAFGIDVVEGNRPANLKVEFVQNKTINNNISGLTNVVVGDGNNVTQSIRDLVTTIESSAGTAEQKSEAKGLLRSFLQHPLVAAIVGSAIGLVK